MADPGLAVGFPSFLMAFSGKRKSFVECRIPFLGALYLGQSPAFMAVPFLATSISPVDDDLQNIQAKPKV